MVLDFKYNNIFYQITTDTCPRIGEEISIRYCDSKKNIDFSIEGKVSNIKHYYSSGNIRYGIIEDIISIEIEKDTK